MVDPLTAVLSGNWAAVTGWGLWIGTVSFVVTLVLTGRLRTEKEYRQLEQALRREQRNSDQLLEQNGRLLQGTEISADFFQKVPVRQTTPPRRRGTT